MVTATEHSSEPQVVLVDNQDVELGRMPKLEAHEKGLLHRALSVFVFDNDLNFILQRRNSEKYHSGGKWSNTACSHPYPEEIIEEAASRRLWEEMGMEAELTKSFSFIYKLDLERNLTEHELDHVFIGFSNDNPNPDDREVSEWRKISIADLDREIEFNPDNFSGWFKLLYKRVWEEAKKLHIK